MGESVLAPTVWHSAYLLNQFYLDLGLCLLHFILKVGTFAEQVIE